MLGNIAPLAASTKSSGFNPSTLILILIVVVAFYLLMIRPQARRRQQEAPCRHVLRGLRRQLREHPVDRHFPPECP